jgi:hypothetical protein
MLTPSSLQGPRHGHEQSVTHRSLFSMPSTGRRKTRLGALSATAIVLASSVTVFSDAALKGSPALAGPCSSGGQGFGCGLDDGGGSGGGGGDSGGSGGGGGGGGIPEAPGDDGSLLPNGEDGQGGASDEPQPTIHWAEIARAGAHLPTPVVNTAPRDKTYVGLRTGLWVNNFVSVETPRIGDGDQQVWAIATPKRVIWDLGEKTITCDGAGSAGSMECSYTYSRASVDASKWTNKIGAHKITATIVWGLTWHCVGSDCDDDFGTLDDMTMTSTPHPLVVDEIQANTRP